MIIPFESPVLSKLLLRRFIARFEAELAEEQAEKLWTLDNEASAVPTLLGGMEVLVALLLETELSVEARSEALTVLHNTATAIAINQYGGPDTRDRAYALAGWAVNQIEPVEGVEIDMPVVAPSYTTLVPEAAPPPVPIVP